MNLTKIRNLAGDGNSTENKAELLFGCSRTFAGEIHHELKFLSVFNALLAISTIIGNTLILISLHKVTSLHPPTKLLLRNLAATDLLVGVISEPLAIVYWTSSMTERWNICRYAFLLGLIIGYTLCGVSLFTVTAMSVDRLLALTLGLSYKQIVTTKRTLILAVAIWVACISCSAMYPRSYLAVIWGSLITITFCLTTSVLSHTKIFLSLRHRENHIQDLTQQEQSSQLNAGRYRKAVSTVLWLQITLLICYLPHGTLAALSSRGRSPSIYLVRQFTVTLVFLNSTLNPALYCLKLKEIREAVTGLWLSR